MPQALLNRVPYDFQSIETEIIVNTKSKGSIGLVEGLEKFDYKCTINRTKFYGRSQLPIIRTEGVGEFDASITIARYWYDYLIAKAAEFKIPLIALQMTISLHYFGRVAGQTEKEHHVDTLFGVRFRGFSHSGEHGPDQLMVTLDLDVMNIFWDGTDICGNRLGGSDVAPVEDPEHPIFPTFINDPAWEFLKLTHKDDDGVVQFYIPGVVSIDNLALALEIDLQKTKGKDGAMVADCGKTPVQWNCTIELTGDEWKAWLAILPKIMPKAGATRTVLAVEHPLLNAHGISNCYVGKLSYDAPSAHRGMKIELLLHEYKKPEETKTKKPAQVAQEKAPARQTAVDNIMNQTFPGSPKPKGPTPEELGYGPPDLIRGYR